MQNSKFFFSLPSPAPRRVQKVCQPDGTFLDQIDKCKPIPCTQADIEEVTPVEGDFVTEVTGESPVNGEIYFRCSDVTKVGRVVVGT